MDTNPSPDLPARAHPFFHLGHPDDHLPARELPKHAAPPPSHRQLLLALVVALATAFLGQWLEHVGEHAATPDVSLPWIAPFVLLLLAIAIMPFLARHFWERHYHHIALALGAIVCTYYLFFLPIPTPPPPAGGFFAARAGGSLAKSLGEYISFIFLLGSLFTVSGGILIRVRRKATPLANVALLLTGAILANIFGTTGAAMLLIRPYLRINHHRIRPYHIVFFIFIVANIGGGLTPIGDPPLFLGYLKGVPFWWVFEHCWPMWLTAIALLLAIFFVIDTLAVRKTAPAASLHSHHDDLGPVVSVFGAANLLLVCAILAGVLLHDELLHVAPLPWRELIMAATAVISLWTTPRRIHLENVFNFAPIKEVAFLFLGIFATMVPALNFLSVHSHHPEFENLLSTPGHFYYSCGTLSSVLDNAPTYLTFLETELGRFDPNLIAIATDIVKDPTRNEPNDADYAKLRALNPKRYEDPVIFQRDQDILAAAVREGLLKYHGNKVLTGNLTSEQIRMGFLLGESHLNWYLVAISLGAVFFGACTYIGNGPNFMVKSIAEHAGVPCPSFFGYLFHYTLPFLVPILILIWWLFLHNVV